MARRLDAILQHFVRPALLRYLKETVTSRAPGGVGASIEAGRFEISDDPLRRSRGYYVSATDVAAPGRGHQITDADGTIWFAMLVEDERGGTFKLTCEKAVTATYTDTDKPNSTQSLVVVPQENVGAIDEFFRKTFTLADGDLSIVSEPLNGHTFTQAGVDWEIQNARQDDHGLWEVRTVAERLRV